MKKVILSAFAIGLIAVGAFNAALQGVRLTQRTFETVKTKVKEKFAVYVPVEIEKVTYDDPNIDTVVNEVSARSGVPADLIYAVIDVESKGNNATRFEPSKYSNDNKAQSEFERIMRNSSHGRMQVMGYNAKLCGMTWQDLYKPKQGIECGVKILRDCLNRSTGRSMSERVTQALGCYNGEGERYPQKVKAALIDRLLRDGKVKLAMKF